jgi:hypothetical protein
MADPDRASTTVDIPPPTSSAKDYARQLVDVFDLRAELGKAIAGKPWL